MVDGFYLVYPLLALSRFHDDRAMANWAEDEFGGAELGDGRLRLRLIKLATRFAEQPTASIPGACGDWAETVAAYRFFDQARAGKRGLNWQSILQPHMDCSQGRMAQHPVVLCLQDTTELDFNGQEIEGLGPLSYEAQRGMYLHPTHAVTPEREPLGVIDAWMWARSEGGRRKPAGHQREHALD
ncbi:MAG: transposase [Candidatus Accumulibacter sp.]|nr:transposase [Accumulibacter sp.]